MTDKQLRQFAVMHAALTTIAKDFMTPEHLRKRAQKQFGLEYEEALEYAYDNIQSIAKHALKGVKLPSREV